MVLEKQLLFLVLADVDKYSLCGSVFKRKQLLSETKANMNQVHRTASKSTYFSLITGFGEKPNTTFQQKLLLVEVEG